MDKNTYGEILEELERSAEKEEDNCTDGILRCEIEQAIKVLKNTNNCGIDGIPADVTEAGGSKTVNKMWEVCR
jgi:hypothetical protein